MIPESIKVLRLKGGSSTMPILPLTNVDSKFGAPRGRSDNFNLEYKDLPLKFFVVHMRMVDWDYDEGGAYWGGGLPLDQMYRAQSDGCHPLEEELQEMFMRAGTREQAKKKVVERYPNAKFYK
jgi:hypothetical protein